MRTRFVVSPAGTTDFSQEMMRVAEVAGEEGDVQRFAREPLRLRRETAHHVSECEIEQRFGAIVLVSEIGERRVDEADRIAAVTGEKPASAELRDDGRAQLDDVAPR